LVKVHPLFPAHPKPEKDRFLSRFLKKFQWYYFLLISGQSEGCQEGNQKYQKGRINKTRIFYLTDPCHQSGRITTTKILNGKGIWLQESRPARKLFNYLRLLYAPLHCQDKNWALGIENISLRINLPDVLTIFCLAAFFPWQGRTLAPFLTGKMAEGIEDYSMLSYIVSSYLLENNLRGGDEPVKAKPFIIYS